MTQQLRAVLFDLDGTLIDSVGLLLGSMRYAFEGFAGATPTDAEWIAGIGTPLMIQIGEYGRTPAESEMLRSRYREYQTEYHDKMISAFPGVVETLKQIRSRGLLMGVVTSKGQQLTAHGLEFTKLAGFFNVVVALEATGQHKPQPEPVLLALKKLGVEPNEAVFVGDSPHDVRAGNAAGVETFAALWGPFRREQFDGADPNYWIRDIVELPMLLERIAAVRRLITASERQLPQ
jgi:pyrophosphatase PpaX